jgi:hypothetical protein
MPIVILSQNNLIVIYPISVLILKGVQNESQQNFSILFCMWILFSILAIC